jgi:hypothetical protein
VAGLAQRRFLPQALVRPVAVVVSGGLGQDFAKMPLAEDQHVMQSRRSVPANRSANEFALGDWTGVSITCVPFPGKIRSWSSAKADRPDADRRVWPTLLAWARDLIFRRPDCRLCAGDLLSAWLQEGANSLVLCVFGRPRAKIFTRQSVCHGPSSAVIRSFIQRYR